MSDAPLSTGTDDQIVTQWQTIISTQMHFNDMLLRTRAIGSSVVMATYGAAAVALGQQPISYVIIFSEFIHISAGIILFALFLLLSIFLLDFFYYFKLLIGTVEIGERLEKENPSLVKQTTQLSQKVSRGSASLFVIVFYAIPAAIGIALLWYILKNYPPTITT